MGKRKAGGAGGASGQADLEEDEYERKLAAKKRGTLLENQDTLIQYFSYMKYILLEATS